MSNDKPIKFKQISHVISKNVACVPLIGFRIIKQLNTKDEYERIKICMTYDEVNNLFKIEYGLKSIPLLSNTN